MALESAVVCEISAYQRTIGELRRERVGLLARALGAEERHVVALEALKRERAEKTAAREKKKGFGSPKKLLEEKKWLEEKCRKLEGEVATKNRRLAEFEEKSAAVEAQVSEAMAAVKRAFEEEGERARRLVQENEALKQALKEKEEALTWQVLKEKEANLVVPRKPIINAFLQQEFAREEKKTEKGEQLIALLQQEVRSLRKKLVESVGRTS